MCNVWQISSLSSTPQPTAGQAHKTYSYWVPNPQWTLTITVKQIACGCYFCACVKRRKKSYSWHSIAWVVSSMLQNSRMKQHMAHNPCFTMVPAVPFAHIGGQWCTSHCFLCETLKGSGFKQDLFQSYLGSILSLLHQLSHLAANCQHGVRAGTTQAVFCHWFFFSINCLCPLRVSTSLPPPVNVFSDGKVWSLVSNWDSIVLTGRDYCFVVHVLVYVLSA